MVTLSALRRDRGRDKRVAVLVGGLETVRESLESALPYGEALETSDILIVPLVLEARPGGGSAGAPATDPSRFQASGRENDLEAAVGRAHVAMPVALNRWQEYVDTEVCVTFLWCDRSACSISPIWTIYSNAATSACGLVL